MYANIIHTKRLLFYRACTFPGLGLHASTTGKLQLELFSKTHLLTSGASVTCSEHGTFIIHLHYLIICHSLFSFNIYLHSLCNYDYCYFIHYMFMLLSYYYFIHIYIALLFYFIRSLLYHYFINSTLLSNFLFPQFFVVSL